MIAGGVSDNGQWIGAFLGTPSNRGGPCIECFLNHYSVKKRDEETYLSSRSCINPDEEQGEEKYQAEDNQVEESTSGPISLRTEIPAASVISTNYLAASLVLSMFLRHLGKGKKYDWYNCVKLDFDTLTVLKHRRKKPRDDCYFCGI